MRTYLAGLPGANAIQVDAVMREMMREAPTQMEFEDDPVVWMFTQGRRKMTSGGQRADIIGINEGDGGADEEAVAGEDPAIAVHRAFARLTPKQQEMLRLKFQFGFNLEEMSRIAGVSQGGANGLVHSGVERICRAAGSTLSLGEGRGGDVRLTAYALDELQPAEKKAFAESVPDAKALLESSDAIKKIGAQLTRVLESGAPAPKRQRRRKGAAWWQSPAFLVGATLAAVAIGGGIWYFAGRPAEKESAREDRVSSGHGSTTVQTRTRAGEKEETRGSGGVNENMAFSGGSGRKLRPGEAAWEKKHFGRGSGAPANATGDGAGNPSGDDANAANPAEPGGEAGPVDTQGGERSAGSRRGALSRNDPAAEKRGVDGKDEADRHPEGREKDSPENEKPATEARPDADDDSSAPTANTPNPAGPRGMKPAKPDVKDATKTSPSDPKAASKIPDKQSQLPVFVPTQSRPGRRAWPKSADVKLANMVKKAPLERGPEDPASPAVTTRLEITNSPWRPDRQIVRATVKARPGRAPSRPAANLVFAIDVSGSMAGPNRLPLVEEGVRLLADRLRPEDRVAVVTYAAQAKALLPGNPLGDKALELRNCLAGLEASGKTNGYEGLQLAYDTARKNLAGTGLNVVILCTDGNFNLGETDENVLGALVAKAAAEGIKLSVFGFGRSDRNDLRLELLATKGGGRSCYVNTSEEAERLLAGQIDGLVETVANDVALDVNFDPDRTADIRRIDGGKAGAPVRELLSGRSLAALYEVQVKAGVPSIDRLAQLDVAYRLAGASAPAHVKRDIEAVIEEWTQLDPEFRFAIAWAEFARILQQPGIRTAVELDRLEKWVREFLPEDRGGYRRELLENVATTRELVAGL